MSIIKSFKVVECIIISDLNPKKKHNNYGL